MRANSFFILFGCFVLGCSAPATEETGESAQAAWPKTAPPAQTPPASPVRDLEREARDEALRIANEQAAERLRVQNEANAVLLAAQQQRQREAQANAERTQMLQGMWHSNPYDGTYFSFASTCLYRFTDRNGDIREPLYSTTYSVNGNTLRISLSSGDNVFTIESLDRSSLTLYGTGGGATGRRIYLYRR